MLGASLTLALLGLFGDLAGVLLVEQRGVVRIAAGFGMLYFGAAALLLVAGAGFVASGVAWF